MKTVGEVLHEQARTRGNADFVVTETDRLTYSAAEAALAGDRTWPARGGRGQG